jgi:hypothetical protein
MAFTVQMLTVEKVIVHNSMLLKLASQGCLDSKKTGERKITLIDTLLIRDDCDL